MSIEEIKQKIRKSLVDAIEVIDSFTTEDTPTPESKGEEEHTPRKSDIETQQFLKLDHMERDELIEYSSNHKIPIQLGKGSTTSKIRSDIKEYWRVMNGNIPSPQEKSQEEDGNLKKKLEKWNDATGCSYECLPDKNLTNCPFGDDPQFGCQEDILKLQKKED
jgi:hypothetical protein